MKMNSKTRIITVFMLAQAFVHTAALAQSLWHEETARAIFADKRAAAVGDILTVVVSENTVANKNNETKTEKNSSLSAAITSFLYPAGATSLLTTGGKLPAMAYNSDLKHDGSGAINNSESIVAHVAVKIIDIDESDTLNPRTADSYSEFLKEVNALKILSENKAKNINHVIEALPVNQAMWMITEHCGGGSVATLVSELQQQVS